MIYKSYRGLQQNPASLSKAVAKVRIYFELCSIVKPSAGFSWPKASKRYLCSSPQASIALIIGRADSPKDVRQITLVPGGVPLFHNGKIIGAIGVGGGTKDQDLEIVNYVVAKFEEIERGNKMFN